MSDMPRWAEGVSEEELLAELKRRADYNLRGWQDSYRSAEYWRKRATAAEEEEK